MGIIWRRKWNTSAGRQAHAFTVYSRSGGHPGFEARRSNCGMARTNDGWAWHETDQEWRCRRCLVLAEKEERRRIEVLG